MTDLQCPVRVHLGPEDPRDDRVALVLDRSTADAADVVAELEELADLYRGEAVRVVMGAALAAEVARRLTGVPTQARSFEGDSEGWSVVGGRPRSGTAG